MYEMLKSTHSSFAWLALIVLVIAVGLATMAFFGKKQLSAAQFRIALYAFITSHIQLLIGLILYFVSPNGMSNMSGETMKDSAARLLAVEHPTINIIAIVMITIGYIKSKKLLNTLGAQKTIMIYYGIGLLLILSRIPWASWLG